VRRRFAIPLVLIVTLVLTSNLSACGQAKEDPAEVQQRQVQQQVKHPEVTQPTQGGQTDQTVGEDIQG
jgi:hypothetical protein